MSILSNGKPNGVAVDADTAALISATEGFDHLFSNKLPEARTQFSSDNSPFHKLGLGVSAFMEAALGMETGLMGEAARALADSEAGAKRGSKNTKSANGGKSSFPPGIEFEILQADAIVLQGLVHALSESYMGYLQCLYALNKLFKTVFPTGLDSYVTPATTPIPSRSPSTSSLAESAQSAAETISIPTTPSKGSFFGRWGLTVPSSPKQPPKSVIHPDGPMEDMIISGAAFGYGLFNLVFSLLPAKVKTVVGLFGFHHDRRLALQALAVAAARKDVHSSFAGLVLMTYHGVVLLLSGYQADEAHIIKQYQAIVEDTISRYPDGALWILNRAKILRMSYNPQGAIDVLQDGLRPDRPGRFQQADALLVFELAWTLLSQRRYQESADAFLRITEINTWSHATYYAIAAGCYLSIGNRIKAKELLDRVPELLERSKIHGKDLPTEVLIRKKLAFYKAKAKRNGADESAYVDFIKISPAEGVFPSFVVYFSRLTRYYLAELAIFWNTHQRIMKDVALAHVKELTSLTPLVTVHNEYIAPARPTSTKDLDHPDELAIRSLILGIVHRTLEDFTSARLFLIDAHNRYPEIVDSKWVGGVALFELAVLDLEELEFREKAAKANGNSSDDLKADWSRVLKMASETLDRAMHISGGSVDLSSRLDSRVNMLKDEIAIKKEKLGLHS
ncbi:hypothetical protein A7U60_g5291 [Sanghuangporus baumii]|uniref:Mitochondrial outer membrane protein IML2 n=1 Tax=Sanghuangporus baumii TaxID=108892 RepID=A0A9Q5N8F1_SANBA|nr:hypothetical protein A7U60_g5291 [Sanghuangporus baumii]